MSDEATLKLVMFETHQQERFGALVDGMIVDLTRAHELCRTKLRESVRPPETFPQTMIGFLELGEDIRRCVSELITRA